MMSTTTTITMTITTTITKLVCVNLIWFNYLLTSVVLTIAMITTVSILVLIPSYDFLI